MKEKLISVIIPVYKVEKYIETCLKSVLNQTYKNLEVIIVNDGTPDNSMKIVEKISKNDDRVYIINQQNLGLSAARNRGLQYAHGEYIFFIDSDDAIHKSLIECLESQMKLDIDIVCAGFVKTDSLQYEDQSMNQLMFQTETGHSIFQKYFKDDTGYWVVAWGKLYRKKLFENIQYPVGKKHEDEGTTYRLIYESRKIAYTNEKLYYYLQRSDSIIGAYSLNTRIDFIDMILERNQFLKEHKETILYQDDFGRSLGEIIELHTKVHDEKSELHRRIHQCYRKWIRINFGSLHWKSKIIYTFKYIFNQI